nr:hypothetical protein [uncultured Holophaga sp.]
MTQNTAILLALLGAVLTVLGTLTLTVLNAIRSDLKGALTAIVDLQKENAEIKTTLRLNGCLEGDPRCRG